MCHKQMLRAFLAVKALTAALTLNKPGWEKKALRSRIMPGPYYSSSPVFFNFINKL